MIRALVVLADGFEEIEAIAPIDLLRRAGVEVTVAGLSGLVATSKRNVRLECDCLLTDALDAPDVLVLPGGLPGAQFLAESTLVQSRVLGQLANGKIVAAICAAPARVLGPLGVLKGRNWSGFPGTEAQNPDGHYQTSAVTVDGLIITGRAAGTALEFSLALVENLCGTAVAARVAAEITWA